jgi:hypothetical protein
MFFVLFLPTWLSGNNQIHYPSELFSIGILFYALTLPGDMRDMDNDSKHMLTLPQVTGKLFAGIIGMVLMILFFAIQYQTAYHEPLGWAGILGAGLFSWQLIKPHAILIVLLDLNVFLVGISYYLI